MTTHPYISGAGNISQMIGFLRKTFPPTVTSETVRKLGLAPKNESYVINVLQFLGLLDEGGKRTDIGHEVMTTHNQEDFEKAFGNLIRAAYADLYEIRADGAWTMTRDELVSYFRSADKTSDIIGTRQASVFMALRELAGYENMTSAADLKPKKSQVGKKAPVKKAMSAAQQKIPQIADNTSLMVANPKSEMALTVRIEINLPAEGTQETYDAIFKSIRANLFP